jgi:predicted naringenin-chalcone synthase
VTELLARITALACAVPDHDIHDAFIDWAANRLPEREQNVFARMAKRSGIDHRWSVLPPTQNGGSPVAEGGFYAVEPLPGTAARMRLYGEHAPELAMKAVARLSPQPDPASITHLIVASCTGFTAPGIDQIIADRLGLVGNVERLLVGFMGCYAAIAALRSARHIVRSVPGARVLVVTVELSTIHLQPDSTIAPLLAMLQFGDGAAAAIVEASGEGLTIESPFALAIADTADLIRWHIGDQGFAMHLSGEVPHRISQALGRPETRALLDNQGQTTRWAVHAGGRSILDAVAEGLGLAGDALDPSRAVLRNFGNMSSATLMFALAHFIGGPGGKGTAIAFGPGLACEGFHFGWTD